MFAAGGFLAFTRDPLGTVARAYQKHGDVFTLRMFHKKITFLVGPEAHLTFFKAVGKDYDVELDQVRLCCAVLCCAVLCCAVLWLMEWVGVQAAV